MSFVLLAGAKRELFAAADWYERRRAGLGDELLEEVEFALRQLESLPGTGAPTLSRYRRSMLRRFPYSVIYRIAGSRIIVVAVAHHKRRPYYWLARARRDDRS